MVLEVGKHSGDETDDGAPGGINTSMAIILQTRDGDK